MKKILILVILGIIIFGVYFPQIAYTQNSNIGQRFIGTWENNVTGATWIFYTNGTFTIDGTVYRYAIAENTIAYTWSGYIWAYNISISSDGRTLILTLIRDSYGDSTQVNWLTKR